MKSRYKHSRIISVVVLMYLHLISRIQNNSSEIKWVEEFKEVKRIQENWEEYIRKLKSIHKIYLHPKKFKRIQENSEELKWILQNSTLLFWEDTFSLKVFKIE